MEKLELKETKGYLGYGVKMRHDYKKARHKNEKHLRLWEMELNHTSLSMAIREQDRKLILRPLSDLTKEIEVNGEKFVPILLIAKMFGFGELEKFELDDDVVEYGWVERYMDDSQPYSFGYFENGEFGTWYDDIDDSHPIQTHCKMEVIEWLYKHHFDIHDLIGKGLAISYNDLKGY